jgi:hypothetical protein
MVHSQKYSIFSNDGKEFKGRVRLTIYDCHKCLKEKLVPTEREDRDGKVIY